MASMGISHPISFLRLWRLHRAMALQSRVTLRLSPKEPPHADPHGAAQVLHQTSMRPRFKKMVLPLVTPPPH